MASKTITLSNTAKAQPGKLVYADLALNSIPATIYLRPVYNNSAYRGALSTDFVTEATATEISALDNYESHDGVDSIYKALSDDATDYILKVKNSFLQTNVTSSTASIGEDGKILFQKHGTKPNDGNIKYNAQARQKAHWKLQKNINATAVKQAIRNIFTWTPGERILDPEFGSNLRQYLYEGITDFNKENIMAEIRHCFTEWEPRAKLENVFDVSSVDDHEQNTVKIEIQYSIPGLSPQQYSYIYETQLSE